MAGFVTVQVPVDGGGAEMRMICHTADPTGELVPDHEITGSRGLGSRTGTAFLLLISSCSTRFTRLVSLPEPFRANVGRPVASVFLLVAARIWARRTRTSSYRWRRYGPGVAAGAGGALRLQGGLPEHGYDPPATCADF